MATDTFVRLPDDTANTGKKAHLRQRTVGADTVHQSLVQVSYPENIRGLYDYSVGELAILSAAHGANEAFAYLINPLASGVVLAVRRVRVVAYPTSTATHASTPIVKCQRFTYTGTPSGAVVTACLRDDQFPSALGSLRLADTGMTVTAGAVAREYVVPLIPSGGGNANNPYESPPWEPQGEEGELKLRPGHGILFRQDSAGEGSDARRVTIGLSVLEYTG